MLHTKRSDLDEKPPTAMKTNPGSPELGKAREQQKRLSAAIKTKQNKKAENYTYTGTPQT